MTRRKAWLIVIICSALFWTGFGLIIGNALAAEPTKKTFVPFIELNCKGINDVVLTQGGTLVAGGKIYRLSHGYLNKMVFTGGVVLEGVIDNDALYFDESTLWINGQNHPCRAE